MNKNQWSYLNYTHWSRKFPECSLTNNPNQSPININRQDVDLDCGLRCQLQVKYQASRCYLVNQNNTITIRYEPGSFILFQNTWYELTKAEIHLPSSHTVDNNHYDMEIDLYHCLDNNCSGGIVLAIFLNAGSEHGKSANFFSQFVNQAPAENTNIEREVEVSSDWNLADVFPDDLTFYFYDGSDAHPPCTQGWKWIVFDQPSNIGITNYKTLKYNIIDKRGENIRPTQPLGKREITKVLGKYVKILRTTTYKQLLAKKKEEEKLTQEQLETQDKMLKERQSLAGNITTSQWKIWFQKNKERIRGLFIFAIFVMYFLLAIQITRYIIRNDLVNKVFSQAGDNNTNINQGNMGNNNMGNNNMGNNMSNNNIGNNNRR